MHLYRLRSCILICGSGRWTGNVKRSGPDMNVAASLTIPKIMLKIKQCSTHANQLIRELRCAYCYIANVRLVKAERRRVISS